MTTFTPSTNMLQTKYYTAIEAERDRRLAIGTDIDVVGYGWIAVRGLDQDRVTLTELREVLATHPLVPTIAYRDRDNAMHNLTLAQIEDIIYQGGPYALSIYSASFAIKDADPRISDVTNDALWPTPTQRP